MTEKRQNRDSARAGSGMLNIVLCLLLTAVPTEIFFWCYRHFYRRANFYAKGNYLFLLLYVGLLVLMLSMYGAYKIRQQRTRELMYSFALSSLITNFIMYFVICLIAKSMQRPIPAMIATAVQWVAEMLLYVLCRIMADRLEPKTDVLYIRREDAMEDELASKFNSRRTSFVLRESVDAALPVGELKRLMDPYHAVLFGEMDAGVRRELMSWCFLYGKKAMLIPDMADVMVGSAEDIIMKDVLLYSLHTEEPPLGYRAAKRALDILASALALILLSPLMLVVGLCIRLYDGGPAFYRQKRLTKNGREFELVKFRSMIVDAESATGAVLAGKRDDRITPIGRFIRATRIDELPQLLNILRGDMTLVGPRPERPEFYKKYCAEFPEFAYRLRTTAGLTGYAQLYGRYNTTFVDKAKLDMFYIQHASFWMDLQLIFYTLKIIFIRESTEGFEPAPDKADTIAEKTEKEETTV